MGADSTKVKNDSMGDFFHHNNVSLSASHSILMILTVGYEMGSLEDRDASREHDPQDCKY